VWRSVFDRTSLNTPASFSELRKPAAQLPVSRMENFHGSIELNFWKTPQAGKRTKRRLHPCEKFLAPPQCVEPNSDNQRSVAAAFDRCCTIALTRTPG
jgi:hypothetical protein